jgi:hypothetical protein
VLGLERARALELIENRDIGIPKGREKKEKAKSLRSTNLPTESFDERSSKDRDRQEESLTRTLKRAPMRLLKTS